GAQGAASGFKLNLFVSKAQFGEKHERRRQGGVAAQINFDSGCEPSQTKGAALPREERSLRQAVLSRDALQKFIGQPLFKWTDPRRVAAESARRERVHLIIRKRNGAFHLRDTLVDGNSARN